MYLCPRRESAGRFCSLRTNGSGMTSDPNALPAAAAAVMRADLAVVGEATVAAIIVEVPDYADAFSGDMGRTIETAVQLALGGFLELATASGGADAGTPIQPALEGAYAL